MTNTQAEFKAWSENFFATHDADGNGTLDKDEAEILARSLHKIRNDGTEFNVERATAQWDALSHDGVITKDALFKKLYERAVVVGKISNP